MDPLYRNYMAIMLCIFKKMTISKALAAMDCIPEYDGMVRQQPLKPYKARRAKT